jgi:hypothetical protein
MDAEVPVAALQEGDVARSEGGLEEIAEGEAGG